MMTAPYRISSGDTSFNSRVDGLFRCLEEAAVDLPKDGLVFDSSECTKRPPPPDDCIMPELEQKFHSQRHTIILPPTGCGESFVIPTQRNIPKIKRMKLNNGKPDYVVNPEKWTCYTMEDTEVMDDAQNREAALQLLSELKSKDYLVQNSTEVIPVDTKIIFRRSNKSHQKNLEKENSSVPTEDIFGGPKKVVMPEYVVGMKKTKKKKNKGNVDISDAKSEKKDVVKLSYLHFQDDDDEEMEEYL